MSSYRTRQLFWPLLSLSVVVGSLGCIINDGKAEDDCDGSYRSTCDGDKIVYCDKARDVRGRDVPGEIKTSPACELGCEIVPTPTPRASCKNECDPNSHERVCLDEATIEVCASFSPDADPSSSSFVPTSYYRIEHVICNEGTRCGKRASLSMIECLPQTTPIQDMGGAPDMSQPSQDMGPDQDMSGTPDMGVVPDMSAPQDMDAADLGPAQDMGSPADMPKDM